MYTLLKPVSVREELLSKGVRIFTPLEFTRVFKVPRYTAKYFLERQVHEGLFLRLKPGLYALKTDQPPEEEIANAVYQPSYLSFEYALAYHNILPEMPYTITSATTKPTRLFTIKNKAYSYRSIKKDAYTGYFLEKRNGRSFLIADKEKALADYFYFVALNKLPRNDRLMLQNVGREKVLGYAGLFNQPKLTTLLNQIP